MQGHDKRAEAEEHLLLSAMTDDGTVLESEVARKFFDLPARVHESDRALMPQQLSEWHAGLKQQLHDDITTCNTQHFE